MLKAKSIYQLILYSIIFIIILVSLFTFIIIDNEHKELETRISNLKKDYTNTQKEILKNELNSLIDFIKYYNNRYKAQKNTKQIQEEVLFAINEMEKDKAKNNYFFIYNFEGILLYNPIEKNLIGNSWLKTKDSTGKFVIQELIKNSKNPKGGFVKYIWYNPKQNKDVSKISYTKSFEPWNWTIGKGVYLDEIEKLIKVKKQEYNEKIYNYTLLIISLTIMLILYSIFIYKNATSLIVNDVKELGKYFKQSQINDDPINENNIKFGEFKTIANYATDAMQNIKIKNTMLEDLNKSLEFTIKEKTKELTNLLESQTKFIKNSVHEINTPLAIIRTNIDLLKMKSPNNKYITNIESGTKIIQNIYNDLSYLIKKDRVSYKKEYLNFSEVLASRLDFFKEIAKANSLSFIVHIEKEIYLKFNSTQLQRIIDNNLSNAIKYSFPNSDIIIKLKYFDDFEIDFMVKTKSKKIQYQDKIFDDFYREDDARGGFGIGLKIVKDICDKNFVKILLSSNNKNTKFIYRFKINENTTT